MKKTLVIIITVLLFVSCKKNKTDVVKDPLEGEWYFRLQNTGGFYAYNDRGAAQFNMGIVKALFTISKAAEGKYYISLKEHAGRVLDYKQVNAYTFLELLPKNGNESQLFNFEKVPDSTAVYYIRSVSNSNHILSGISNGFNYSLFFDVLKPYSLYRQQWKLEK
jgi:hypothetical protein